MKGGIFYEQKNISAPLIAEIFIARLLSVLLEQGVIKQELINMLLCRNHHSGFNIHVRGQIAGTDGDAIESIAKYMSRAPISVDRVEFNPEDNTITANRKIPKSTARPVCPKTEGSPQFNMEKSTRQFKIGKFHPYPTLMTIERSPKTEKINRKNLLDSLYFGE